VTAETVGNYQVRTPSGSSVSINSATRTTSNTVTLVLASFLNDLTEYTVTVNNVLNLSGVTIVAGSNAKFTLSCGLNCITDTFSGPGALSSSWEASSSNGSFGTPRIVDNGRLRLTDASGNVATVATLLNQFPGAENKIEIEFDYYAYDGSGADGISVIFSDADISPVPGSYGGALGYAQRSGGGSGFAGGWLGVGIDEYGNFANNNEGKDGGSGFEQDSVALRGSGSGSTGYPYLTSTGTLSPGIDLGGSAPNPGHRYKIIIDHTMGGSEAYVTVERDTGAGYVEIIPRFDVFTVNASQAAVPENWVVSFTGSTGGATNIHEIGDFQVCAAQPISGYGSPDHYAITHSSPGVTCEGSQITVTAHDAAHTALSLSSDTSLTITTTPSIDSIVSSPTTISSGASSTTFYLHESVATANIDIDVTDGTATDPDDAGSEDSVFNFVDTAFRFYVGGTHTDDEPIGVQIAGKSSAVIPDAQSLSLKAIRTNTDTGECEAALQSVTTSVDIAYECNNPTTCSGSNLLSIMADSTATVTRNNNGATLSYTGVNMAFDGSGIAPLSFNYSDAGQITLHAKKDVSASVPDPAYTLMGSSNTFWTRPDKLLVTAKSSGSDISGATSASTTIHKASENFDLVVAAVTNDGSTVTANYQPGQIQLLLDRTGPASGGADGTLTYASSNSIGSALVPTYQNVSLTAFSAGISTYAAANYSEVGLLNLDLQDSNYGSSAITVEGDAIDIGRFIPDHFTVSAGNGAFDNACGSFTYIGQSFSYDSSSLPDLTITAKNGASTPATTANYTETGYQKLSANDVTRAWPTSDSTLTLVSSPAGSPGTVSVGGSAGESIFTFNSADSFQHVKNAGAEVIPFTSAITISTTAIQDSDGVVATTGLPASSSPTGVAMRYGRWVVDNAYGPETSALNIPMRAEYYDGTNYVLNTEDSCSAFNAGVMVVNSNLSGGTTAASGTGTASGGVATIQMSTPGTGNVGIVDLCLNVENWLKYDWNGDGINLAQTCDVSSSATQGDNPMSTATFGQYRGNDRIIYWREVNN